MSPPRATCCVRSGSRRAGETDTSRSRSTPTSPTTRTRSTRRRKRLHEAIERAEPAREDPGDQARRRPRSRTRSPPAARSTSRSSSRSSATPPSRAPTSTGSTRFRADGGDVATLHSVASFFVSRVDTRDRPQARRPRRARRAAREARDREREARLRALPGALLPRRRALGRAVGGRRTPAALPVGLDLDQEPRLPGRALRRGADRPRDGEHDARGNPARLPGPRPRRADARARARGGASAARAAGRGRRRLRRRRRDARGRGDREVHRRLLRAARRAGGKAADARRQPGRR